jgi:hypothetical protein
LQPAGGLICSHPGNFDTGGFCVGENVQFLDPDPCGSHAWIDQARFGDPFGKGLDQPGVTDPDNRPDACRDPLVVDHARQFVRSNDDAGSGSFVDDAEIDVDPDPLLSLMLVWIDANAGGQHHVAQKDVPELGLEACDLRAGDL